jgi:glycosyltransferase involved in cell wall biosynthesis
LRAEHGRQVRVSEAEESALARQEAGQPARPLFSIVTPSFNQARFLPDALWSVQCQRHTRCEHIVIDAGSSDGTREILASAPDSVRFVIEPDEGQSDALNKGLRLARGEIIGWLNGDDFYLPGALRAVETFLAANPDVQVVYGDAVVVDQDGRVIRGLQEHRFDFSVLLYYDCYIHSTSTFFRSSLVDSGLLRLDTALHSTMDLDLFLRLAANHVRFGYLPHDLAAFRWHSASKGQTIEAAGIAEKIRVQRANGAALHSDLGLRVLRRLFRVKHGTLKLASGAYLRQLRWARSRGDSLIPNPQVPPRELV